MAKSGSPRVQVEICDASQGFGLEQTHCHFWPQPFDQNQSPGEGEESNSSHSYTTKSHDRWEWRAEDSPLIPHNRLSKNKETLVPLSQERSWADSPLVDSVHTHPWLNHWGLGQILQWLVRPVSWAHSGKWAVGWNWQRSPSPKPLDWESERCVFLKENWGCRYHEKGEWVLGKQNHKYTSPSKSRIIWDTWQVAVSGSRERQMAWHTSRGTRFGSLKAGPCLGVW